MTAPAGQQVRRGVPFLRSWTRVELLLAGVLLGLAVMAWVLSDRLAMPGMEVGLLTGLGSEAGARAGMMPVGAGFFLLTWVVMMAAMMLPAITPFTVGVRRLVSARAGTLALLTLGYLLVWSAAGVVALLVTRWFDMVATGGGVMGVRVGAVLLLLAGAYQFTPLKRWCLVRCRSPFALVMRHGPQVVGSRPGALRVGLGHGGYCLGCCWGLMLVLLAVGMMSLVWMAVLAAVIAVEKVLPRGELLGSVVGVVLVGLGAFLLVTA